MKKKMSGKPMKEKEMKSMMGKSMPMKEKEMMMAPPKGKPKKKGGK